MTQTKTDPRVDKRRVTMTNVVFVGVNAAGERQFQDIIAVDYVRPDFLDAYVAEAKTRWTSVEVSDEPDAGPAGYDGETRIPASLDHPQAGAVFAATNTKED